METRIVIIDNNEYTISDENIEIGHLIYDYAKDRVIMYDGRIVDGGSCSDHCWKVIEINSKVECHDCKGSGIENLMLVSLGADESICNRCSGTGLEDERMFCWEFNK